AGFGAHTVMVGTFAIWGDTQIFGTTIGWFCALYALTVWTPTRTFAIGAAYVFVSNLAAAAGSAGTISRSGPFAIVTLVVMLLVRFVVGDMERRAQLAERERIDPGGACGDRAHWTRGAHRDAAARRDAPERGRGAARAEPRPRRPPDA